MYFTYRVNEPVFCLFEFGSYFLLVHFFGQKIVPDVYYSVAISKPSVVLVFTDNLFLVT